VMTNMFVRMSYVRNNEINNDQNKQGQKVSQVDESAKNAIQSEKNTSQRVIRHGISMPPKILTKINDTDEKVRGKELNLC